MSLPDVLKLTIPQLHTLEKQLIVICKAENGNETNEDAKRQNNQNALGATVKMLNKETGRTKFTMEEIANPTETIKKYKQVK